MIGQPMIGGMHAQLVRAAGMRLHLQPGQRLRGLLDDAVVRDGVVGALLAVLGDAHAVAVGRRLARPARSRSGPRASSARRAPAPSRSSWRRGRGTLRRASSPQAACAPPPARPTCRGRAGGPAAASRPSCCARLRACGRRCATRPSRPARQAPPACRTRRPSRPRGAASGRAARHRPCRAWCAG